MTAKAAGEELGTATLPEWRSLLEQERQRSGATGPAAAMWQELARALESEIGRLRGLLAPPAHEEPAPRRCSGGAEAAARPRGRGRGRADGRWRPERRRSTRRIPPPAGDEGEVGALRAILGHLAALLAAAALLLAPAGAGADQRAAARGLTAPPAAIGVLPSRLPDVGAGGMAGG